jgi:Domain of unknown function (DUF4337)
LHEAINEHAKEGNKWSLYLAISTAFMAVLAAIAGLMAGHYSNEALIEQIKASDQWAYYQAKGIKSDIISVNPVKDTSKIEKYKTEQLAINKIAKEFESKSEIYLEKRVICYLLAVVLLLFVLMLHLKPALDGNPANLLKDMAIAIGAIIIGNLAQDIYHSRIKSEM